LAFALATVLSPNLGDSGKLPGMLGRWITYFDAWARSRRQGALNYPQFYFLVWQFVVIPYDAGFLRTLLDIPRMTSALMRVWSIGANPLKTFLVHQITLILRPLPLV